MSRAVVLAAVVAACCGVAGGVLGGWLAAGDPGSGNAAPGTLRGDLDALRAETLGARAAHAEAMTRLAERVTAVETAAAASGSAGAEDVARAIGEISADLRLLRDATARDLRAADLRLTEIEQRLAGLLQLAALAPPTPRNGALTDEEEGFWYTVAGDSDPLRRFSALNILGRTRTDRSVRASRDALKDSYDLVVCQALRNLGRFAERAAAKEIAALLEDARVNVRAAAHESLRTLGAPDVGFDPAALPERRAEGSRRLSAWASAAQ